MSQERTNSAVATFPFDNATVMSNNSLVSTEHEMVLRRAVSTVFKESLASNYATVGPETVTELDSAVSFIVQTQLQEEKRLLNQRVLLHSRLPPELWTRAWQNLCLKDLVAATHVCHAWRVLAISSPGLWTYLRFSYYYNDVDDDLYQVPPIKLRTVKQSYPTAAAASILLERSRDRPLSIKLNFNNFHLKNVVRRLGDAFYGVAHRIQSIEIDVDHHLRFLPEIIGSMGGRFPNLLRLHCRGNWSYERELQNYLISFADEDDFWAPNLRYLWTTPGIWCDWPAGSNTRMEHLHTLSYTPLMPADMARVLRLCPGIKVLTLNFGRYFFSPESEPDAEDLASIAASHLEELVVQTLNPKWSERAGFEPHWSFFDVATRRTIEVQFNVKINQSSQDIIHATHSLPRMLRTFRDICGSPESGFEVVFDGASFDLAGVAITETGTRKPRSRILRFHHEMTSPCDLFSNADGLWTNINPKYVTKLNICIRFLYWLFAPETETLAGGFGVPVLPSVTELIFTDPRPYTHPSYDQDFATLRRVDWRVVTPKVEVVALSGEWERVARRANFTGLDDFLIALEANPPFQC